MRLKLPIVAMLTGLAMFSSAFAKTQVSAYYYDCQDPFIQIFDKALKQISKYKTEFDTLAATIDALNKQDYSGRDEFIQKIKDKQNGLSKRISREEVVVHIDYNSDFEHQCRVHNIYIAGIKLDSETEFCIEDFI